MYQTRLETCTSDRFPNPFCGILSPPFDTTNQKRARTFIQGASFFISAGVIGRWRRGILRRFAPVLSASCPQNVAFSRRSFDSSQRSFGQKYRKKSMVWATAVNKWTSPQGLPRILQTIVFQPVNGATGNPT